MLDYSLPLYDEYRNWINKAREKGNDWVEIRYAMKGNLEGLAEFLKKQEENNFWEINAKQWIELVDLQEEADKKSKYFKFVEENALITDENLDNGVKPPTDPKSSWQLYKARLYKNGMKKEAVDSIEYNTLKILRRLSNDTTNTEPIKGLVIGNVQSGKTANMAALMAMAADWGWNMFIVLSGTIENLRQQTQKRLLNDLNSSGNLSWRGLEHLSKKIDYAQRLQHLRFDEDSVDRYFTVCLKNGGRLKNLIEWLQSDPNKQKQLKIIVIDDEADQAGINTADITKNERKRINDLMVKLVGNRDVKGKELETRYKAMNYIGYTATPYANILNEPPNKESLYPANFISTLSVSKEYFGPQQIFGANNTNYQGMDIIRIIGRDELELVKCIHDGKSSCAPESLVDSICWFLCGAAVMRKNHYKKPISMLVHTSQKQEHHEYISEVIENWINNTPNNKILERCKKVYARETKQLSKKAFREQYLDYDRLDEDINDYPEFSEIFPIIEKLISEKMSNIKLDEEGDLKYHEGIHLCVDNCKNNGVSDEGMFVRLAYPEEDNRTSVAPVFIVIGGATLSRGLTIEGLISSFFLRSVGQADTLMQMGRWFGYRKNYELIPRIWISEKTNEQFKFLSELDQELRNEILYMEANRINPSQYGPKVKNTPKYSFIKITGKNKMQSGKLTDLDYSGTSSQTSVFDNIGEELLYNKLLTEKFLNSLGKPEYQEEVQNAVVWRNIEYTSIFDELLNKFKFCSKSHVFNDIKSLREWIKKVTDDGKLGKWNVVLAGVGKANQSENNWVLQECSVNKVKRTRIKQSIDDDLINIGVLTTPKDFIADIDYRIISEELKEEVNYFHPARINIIRSKAGLDMTPQLLIYLIDKDSMTKNENRRNLNANADIVGLAIRVPGGKRGSSLATAVAIKIDKQLFNEEGDVENN